MIMLFSPKKFLPISPIYLIFELKLLLQHFGEQRQAKRLVFIEKYASKHVQKLRKLKQYAVVILFYVEQHKCPTVILDILLFSYSCQVFSCKFFPLGIQYLHQGHTVFHECGGYLITSCAICNKTTESKLYFMKDKTEAEVN